jgi:hypothetical protein
MDNVIFRMIQGEVSAFLPDEDVNFGQISCYEHVGQHGAASLDYYRKGRPATPREHADLKAELRSMGYKLKVIRRLRYGMLNWQKRQ